MFCDDVKSIYDQHEDNLEEEKVSHSGRTWSPEVATEKEVGALLLYDTWIYGQIWM